MFKATPDWHAINDAVIAYGTALLDADDDRVGAVEALGVDEMLFARQGRWRTQAWSTSIVDVATGQAAPRCHRGSFVCGSVRLACRDARRVARRDLLGGAGPVGSVAARVRHDTARRRRSRIRSTS